MIDWLKLRLPYKPDRQIGGDRVLVLDPDGNITWEKLKPLEVVGSHDGSLRVSCCPITGELVIDGNPVKFLQGHNLFGTDDLRELAYEVAAIVFRRVGLEPTPELLESLEMGAFDVARVDVTAMYSLGSLAAVRAALRALEQRARFRNRGRGTLQDDGTLYFGKHSRRWSPKLYAKGDEIEAKGHRLSSKLYRAADLGEWAQDKLRVEFVIRSMELKRRGLDRASSWCHTTASDLYRELLGKLELPDMIELPSASLEGLPPRLLLAYDSWKRGEDLRAKLSRPTFYRYRKELLGYGIDIASLQPSEPTNVVPLIRILEAVPAGVPEWAVGTPLYWEPRRKTA